MSKDSSATSGSQRLRYGIEAPYVPAAMGAGVALFAVLGVFNRWLLVASAVFLAQAAIFLYTTTTGKLRVWESLLDELALRGDETLLDLGCGRGAVLVAATRRLPNGIGHGIDLWHNVDQSGNNQATTMVNARAAGVADRVQLHTGDMRELPFPNESMDVVTSALAIHNISDAAGRKQAVAEAWRVLKPGGRLVLVDYRHTGEYRRILTELGAGSLTSRGLGFRYWYGGPWAATSPVVRM